MNQDAIWDHFQNEGVDAFRSVVARPEFLVRQLKAGEQVLNIGVGSAVLERFAMAKGVNIWVLDPSERTVQKIRDDLGLGERAQVGYSQHIPFPDGQFDTVIMSEVLEHLTPDIFQPSLSEVRRVLRLGGRLIGTVPARERLKDSEVICPQCRHHFHRWGHQRSFDTESMRTALADKFAIERVEERFFMEWDAVGWGRRGLELLKKFLSWRGYGTYGSARNIYFIARTPAGSDCSEAF